MLQSSVGLHTTVLQASFTLEFCHAEGSWTCPKLSSKISMTSFISHHSLWFGVLIYVMFCTICSHHFAFHMIFMKLSCSSLELAFVDFYPILPCLCSARRVMSPDLNLVTGLLLLQQNTPSLNQRLLVPSPPPHIILHFHKDNAGNNFKCCEEITYIVNTESH